MGFMLVPTSPYRWE